MHEFTDNQDGVWRIVINVGVVKRVRDTLGVDLMDLLARGEGEEERLLVRLMIDPVLLCDVIYCVCREQADERGASDEDFGRAMAGDAIDAATQALLEEIVAFFPNARDRTRAQTVLQKTREMIGRMQDVLDERLTNGELDREMEKAIRGQRSSGDSSTGSPESSASSPTP